MLSVDAIENIGGRIAALSFSAVGPILLDLRLEQKTAPKARASMSSLLFTLNIKKKCWW